VRARLKNHSGQAVEVHCRRTIYRGRLRNVAKLWITLEPGAELWKLDEERCGTLLPRSKRGPFISMSAIMSVAVVTC